MIRYGFACKTIGLPGAAQSSLALARASRDNLLAVSRNNLGALEAMLRYCRSQSLALMRISSDIIPLASHEAVHFDWQAELRLELENLAALARQSGVRLSMHPGQYTVLNSPRQDVVRKAVADLAYHAAFLDALQAGPECRIILHLGGGYGDKASALQRLRANLAALPDGILQRLALENDERIYTIEDVLAVCHDFELPAIFDIFHHELNPPLHGDLRYWLDRAGATWNARSGRQKIHYSQQLTDSKAGMHSLTIAMRPFMQMHSLLEERELDVMLEVKDKNLSAIKCANLTQPDLPRKNLTEEWARYKYLVLERSPSAYSAIRQLLKSERPAAEAFYALLEEALACDLEPGKARNAAEHVWGYVSKKATPSESTRMLKDLELLGVDLAPLPRIKRKILALATSKGEEYLLHSLYFYLN
ncbi:MAG: UV damage repair endonuclease UvsE [Desulfovibrio sp. MES5]|nr:MAG: UV damage repair endonuclease UvsE [Desulfovibrio sp. MES5]